MYKNQQSKSIQQIWQMTLWYAVGNTLQYFTVWF